MFDGLRARYHAVLRRIRRFERREVREFRRWLEHTTNLLHLTILLVVPVLIAGVTALSNAVDLLPFVLFPPLASGTYTLFADPEGEYASPRKFVGGLTAGALCGTAAIWVAMHTPIRDPLGGDALVVSPAAAGLAVLFTGAATWAMNLEEPSAFSTALLALIAPAFSNPGDVGEFLVQFAGSVFVASGIVAAAFVVWRREFYEQRSRLLYQSTKGDDHVLVPMRGERASTAAAFAAGLAAAHEAGKVVLLEVVDEAAIERADADTDARTADEARVADESVEWLEREADRIRTEVGVPCEVVVAGDGTNPASTTLDVARETNCDLVVAPYEEDKGSLSPFVRGLFGSDVDAVAFRSTRDAPRGGAWDRVLVPVRRPGETAHRMIDFARRLAGLTGSVSVCTCIDTERERRPTERMLANLVETFEGSFETRVSRSSIESFLAANDRYYDLVIMGASTDRSTASRFVSPPTFERLHDLECDVAIVHRGS